jgi:hypothetical protein
MLHSVTTIVLYLIGGDGIIFHLSFFIWSFKEKTPPKESSPAISNKWLASAINDQMENGE